METFNKQDIKYKETFSKVIIKTYLGSFVIKTMLTIESLYLFAAYALNSR